MSPKHAHLTVSEIRSIVEQQRRRCLKPHFDSLLQYEGRPEIEAWNYGVESLARSILEVVQTYEPSSG